jgi:hypothetical protein
MQLVRAHGDVEGGHRADAWKILLDNTTDPEVERTVVLTCKEALARWHFYRDGVAERMGLQREPGSSPLDPIVVPRAS